MSSDVTLRGSRREHPENSVLLGKPAPDKFIQLTLVLKRRQSAPDPGSIASHYSHAQLSDLHGADPADIEAVEAFASEHGFTITRLNTAARTIAISGPCGELAAAFGADLDLRGINGQVVRTRQGGLTVPESLAGGVVAVLGFDQRPVARTHHRVKPRDNDAVAYTPLQIAQAYHFPTNKGKNQTIALIELGGGFRNSDLKKYWKQLKLSNVAVTAVSVDGAHNSPAGDAAGPDGEVMLDIEVAGAIAPDARIAVYFANNTDQGFLEAANAVIHDSERKPSVISISWGSGENTWTEQARDAFNSAFHDAALLGISVCVAAGDNGSSDGEPDSEDHVDFPASSPWVLACGGTRLEMENGKIKAEMVWTDGTNGGATGGGISAYFPQPSYQTGIQMIVPQENSRTSGRGVPDVSGVADPETGYLVLVDGQEGVVGGTSAVAPLWAGLIALWNEQLGQNVGWFHPKLYGTLAQHRVLNDVTCGTNGDFKACTGWDACTGLGTPNGQAILSVLKQLPIK
jgi:kumamolisin